MASEKIILKKILTCTSIERKHVTLLHSDLATSRQEMSDRAKLNAFFEKKKCQAE